MRLLPLALILVSLALAGCESAPPKVQRSIVEKTVISDAYGTREVKPTHLTPEARPPR
jgi:starvation-inducible outer membrane lipoprotein